MQPAHIYDCLSSSKPLVCFDLNITDGWYALLLTLQLAKRAIEREARRLLPSMPSVRIYCPLNSFHSSGKPSRPTAIRLYPSASCNPHATRAQTMHLSSDHWNIRELTVCAA
jgi:hypothetical protein